jgi:hypothetical protein
MGLNLNIGVIEIILRVFKGHALLENDIVCRSTTADNGGLNSEGALGLDRDIDICATNAPCCLRYCIGLSIICCDAARRSFSRRVRDNLQESRYIPVLVESVVCFSGGNVQSHIMGQAVGKHRCKWCEIKEVGRKIDCTIRCDGPVNHMVEGKTWESATSYLQTAGFMPPVKMTAYGKATPATWPSTRRRTSRKGPPPYAAPGGRYPRYSSAVL